MQGRIGRMACMAIAKETPTRLAHRNSLSSEGKEHMAILMDGTIKGIQWDAKKVAKTCRTYASATSSSV